LLDENCTSSSFMQFPFLCSLTTPVSWALFVIINGSSEDHKISTTLQELEGFTYATALLDQKRGIFPIQNKGQAELHPQILITAHTSPVHGSVWAVLRVSISAWNLAFK
jgi:uncharacterized protein (UPF0276 family)